MRRYLLYILLLFPGLCAAQNISDKLVKQSQPTSYWTTFRFDYYLKSGSFFFVENNNRFNIGNDRQFPVGNTFPFNSIYRTYILAGYEHKASEKWYLGLSEKFVILPFRKSLYTRVNISHRGKLSKLKFVKEAAFEHLNHSKSNNPNIIIENEGRVSFSPALIKELSLKEKPLYIILAYRAYMLFDFNKDSFSSYDKRVIDKTRLRFELAYKISENWMLSLFTMRDTDYSYQLQQTDISGNILVEEARVNKVTPTFGLTVNFLLNSPEDYIPGFPIK
ncbi:MAG: hypothetical protein K2X86_06600 [Cytophagaceae bacterium]|nr:hypothetical protein [Cytophagaceae bacterium]